MNSEHSATAAAPNGLPHNVYISRTMRAHVRCESVCVLCVVCVMCGGNCNDLTISNF